MKTDGTLNLTDDHCGENIKVIGVGGAGCNVINSLVYAGLPDVTLIGANTDRQALSKCKAEIRIELGEKAVGGKGSGANPEIGKIAAEESMGEIIKHIRDADMVMITAGMGGGTGTGAVPVIARTAKDCGAYTAAVLAKPFTFEGRKRCNRFNMSDDTLAQSIYESVMSFINKENGISGEIRDLSKTGIRSEEPERKYEVPDFLEKAGRHSGEETEYEASAVDLSHTMSFIDLFRAEEAEKEKDKDNNNDKSAEIEALKKRLEELTGSYTEIEPEDNLDIPEPDPAVNAEPEIVTSGDTEPATEEKKDDRFASLYRKLEEFEKLIDEEYNKLRRESSDEGKNG